MNPQKHSESISFGNKCGAKFKCKTCRAVGIFAHGYRTTKEIWDSIYIYYYFLLGDNILYLMKSSL